MLLNSKCSALAFLCYNIIFLIFSIQVSGQLQLFQFRPSDPDTPFWPPMIPYTPVWPPFIPYTSPHNEGSPPPDFHMLPHSLGLPPPIPHIPHTLSHSPRLPPPDSYTLPYSPRLPPFIPHNNRGLPAPDSYTLPHSLGLAPPIHELPQTIPGLLTPPSVLEICPKNKLTMKIACANVIGIPVLPVSKFLNPLSSPCCKYIEGLLDIEVAACFCSAVTFDASGPKTNIPVSLVSLLKYCQKELTRDFQCATGST